MRSFYSQFFCISSLTLTLLLSGCHTCRSDKSHSPVSSSNQKTEQTKGSSFSLSKIFSFSKEDLSKLLEEQELDNLANNYPETLKALKEKRALSNQDIIALHHVTYEEKLIQLIEKSQTDFQLSASQIIRLKDRGLSNLVIHQMLKKGAS